MSVELVTVTASWQDGQGNYANGNYEFVCAGNLMESSQVAIVTPFIDGNLDSLGSLSLLGKSAGSGIPLLASDNPGFAAGAVVWNVKIIVQGFPNIIVNNVEVNYALGASQGLFSILESAGWTNPPTPA